ncbi:MAG: FAD-binding oxidoreductase [Veillonellales bacterium]
MKTESTMSVQSRQEISAILQQAARDKTTLCVYREKVPAEGRRLDLGKLKALTEIDSDNLVATVEPGLLMGDLAETLAQKGLRFIPADAPYYRHLTVGEWVYHGCPSVSSWKYGPGKHTLMGSTYILPSGKSIRTGGKTVKNVTGYDFTRFLAGAYCDIGIGVEFLLKLLPQPECRMTFTAGFVSLQQVFSFINDLRNNPVSPAFLLAADDRTQRLLLGRTDTVPFLIEFELDGVTQEVDGFGQKVRQWAKRNQALSVTTAAAGTEDDFLPLKNLFASQSAGRICDEWKVLYDKQQPVLAALGQAYPQLGWFGQWAEGKVHAAFAKDLTDVAAKAAAISDKVKQSGGAASGSYDRRQGKLPDGPLGKLEAQLRRTIDPQEIFAPQEGLA